MSDKKKYCVGCRDDFYNSGNNEIGVKECWSLKEAEIVTRYKLAWWSPTLKANCKKVKTLDCHYEPGRFAFLKELPLR